MLSDGGSKRGSFFCLELKRKKVVLDYSLVTKNSQYAFRFETPTGNCYPGGIKGGVPKLL
jgi:hypothetical protein